MVVKSSRRQLFYKEEVSESEVKEMVANEEYISIPFEVLMKLKEEKRAKLREITRRIVARYHSGAVADAAADATADATADALALSTALQLAEVETIATTVPLADGGHPVSSYATLVAEAAALEGAAVSSCVANSQDTDT